MVIMLSKMYWLLLCCTYIFYSLAQECTTDYNDCTCEYLTANTAQKNSMTQHHKSLNDTKIGRNFSIPGDHMIFCTPANSSVYITNATSNSINITWQKGYINTSKYSYWLVKDYALPEQVEQNTTSILNNEYESDELVNISGLTPYSQYYITLKISNASKIILIVINTTERDLPIEEVKQKLALNSKEDVEPTGNNVTLNGSMMYNSIIPPAPPAPINLEVYTKSEICAHLRWKNYNIADEDYDYQIESTSTTTNATNITQQKCTLWKGKENYICGSICNLSRNMKYTFKIRAKYAGMNTFGNFSQSASTKTVIEEPEPPQDLTYSWNGFNLSLTWRHPLFPNGQIKDYRIFFNDTQISTYTKLQNISHIKPNQKYNCTINATNFTAQMLTVSVKSQNAAGNSTKSAAITIAAPPKQPSFICEACKAVVNNSHIRINISNFLHLEGTSYLYLLEFNKQMTRKSNLPMYCSNKTLLSSNISKINLNRSQNSLLIIENYTRSNVGKILAVLTNEFENHIACKESVLQLDIINNNSTNSDDANNKSSISTPLAVFIGFLLLSCIIAAARFYCVRRKYETPKQLQEESNCSSVKSAPVFSQAESIEDFKNYIAQDEQLLQQFQTINGLDTKPRTVGQMLENRYKNRYQNIIPYDDTRVILKPIDGVKYYDEIIDSYINANYLNGFQRNGQYIAAQGPLDDTVDDFWRMIWQENVECIVMLTNIIENKKKKCESYWPSLGGDQYFSDVEVKTIQDEALTQDITKRVFQVQCNDQTRMVTHIHFTEWPDHNVPHSPTVLAEAILEVRKCNIEKSPILVHCSAGVGRSGTFILCDIALEMAEITGQIDVLKILTEMRQQRMLMVQTFAQYNYAHKVILELIGCKDAITENMLP